MKTGLIACVLVMLATAGHLAGGVPLDGVLLARYAGLGFRHILPGGIDHVLFVLGLFVLARDVVSLLWQVTAFTMAHSMTFGLALLGVVALPERAVEVAVALSIAVVAAENFLPARVGRWRLATVFGFGLIHGLAFAHTFRGHEVPPEQWAPALLAFNFGIGLGQLAVVLAAFVLAGAFWQRPWYRRAVVIPVSGVMAFVGLIWAVGRAMA